MPIRDRNVLCIDWDERSLRVLDANLSRSTVRVRNALHVPLAPGTNTRDPASLGDFLRRTLAEHRIRTRRAIVDIPRQDTVLNLLSLPKGTSDELAAMVHMQIGKDLPFPKDQAVIDFAVSHDRGDGTLEVWVSAVRNHVIDHYREVITSAGLKLDRIGLRPYANLAAMTQDREHDGYTMVVDVGPSHTEINVIRDGRLVFSRAASVSVPVTGLTEPPPRAADADDIDESGGATIPLADDFGPQRPVDALLIEVSRTFEAYRAGDPGSRLDRIILAGSIEIDQTVCGAFESRFAASATTFGPPEGLRWAPKGGGSVAPFSAVLGLAITTASEERERFDFLHPTEPEAGRRERVRRMPKFAAVIAMFIVAGGWTAYRPIYHQQRELKKIEDKVKKLDDSDERKDRKAFMKKMEDLEAWQTRSLAWIDHFERIAQVFPDLEDGYMKEISVDEKGRITIEMAVRDRKVVPAFVRRINEIVVEVPGKRGKPVKKHPFEARPDDAKPVPDTKYPFRDKVLIQVKAFEDD